jgi:hypothetical protein
MDPDAGPLGRIGRRPRRANNAYERRRGAARVVSASEVVAPRRRIITVKRSPFGGRRSSCGSEGTRARAAPPSRWSRASPAAACLPAPRRAACGCGRNDTRTGLRRKERHSTSSRSTPTWRLDYASSVRNHTTASRGWAFTFTLELPDGTSPNLPSFHIVVPTWRPGDTIPLGLVVQSAWHLSCPDGQCGP